MSGLKDPIEALLEEVTAEGIWKHYSFGLSIRAQITGFAHSSIMPSLIFFMIVALIAGSRNIPGVTMGDLLPHLAQVRKRHGVEARCPVHRFSQQMWPHEAMADAVAVPQQF